MSEIIGMFLIVILALAVGMGIIAVSERLIEKWKNKRSNE